MEKAIAYALQITPYIIGGGENYIEFFQTKLNLRASITTLKQMFFPEIN
jgi:hypothetical protein